MTKFVRPMPQTKIISSKRLLPGLIAAISLSAQADDNNAAKWDWVSSEQLSNEQRCKADTGCNGAYIEPAIDWPEANVPPEEAKVHAEANTSEIIDDTVNMSGEVVLTKGQRRVTADSMSLNQQSNELKLTGNIVIREPNLLMRCSAGQLNTDTGLGTFTDTQILNYDTGLRVQSKRLTRPDEWVFDFEDAAYTLCPPTDEVWSLNADELSLDQERGWGTAKDVVIRIKDVPVFYTPYATFPIDDRRKSGFLWPTIASDDGALDLSVPYYFNIAPDWDATLTPRRIGQHGNFLEAETRHLNTYSAWTLSGGYMKHDETIDDKRWIGVIEENGHFTPYLSHSIDYTKVSDKEFFRDLSLNSINAKRKNHISQSGSIALNTEEWTGSILVQQYQSLDDVYTRPYERLPQITLANRARGENFTVDFSGLLEFTEFDHPESFENGGEFYSGQRQYGEVAISYPMRWSAGFIIPSTKLRHVSYELDGMADHQQDTPEATAPMGSIDAGLFFERTLSAAGKDYTQTLEPRIYQLYSDYEYQQDLPNFDTKALQFSYQQLFRDTRFSGHDRIDDANQTTVGITTRFIDNSTGLEKLTLSAGQIFYWDDQRIQQNLNAPAIEDSSSLIAAEVQYQPSSSLWLGSNVLWDSRQDKIEEYSFNTQYHSNTLLWNLGYRYKRVDPTSIIEKELEQADISTRLPINEQWQLMARFQYDINEDRSIEDLFGIEYQDCCWLTRIVYQRADKRKNSTSLDIERDEKIVLQFQLKGLGGIGNKAAKILEESILGYNRD